VSSISQNKLFDEFFAPFLHPQSPVGTSNSKLTHWELGRPPASSGLLSLDHAASLLQALVCTEEEDFALSYSLSSGKLIPSSSGFDAQPADTETTSPSLENGDT